MSYTILYRVRGDREARISSASGPRQAYDAVVTLLQADDDIVLVTDADGHHIQFAELQRRAAAIPASAVH
jgi:hypothetical protein